MNIHQMLAAVARKKAAAGVLGRGLFGGGYIGFSNVSDYVTIATTGTVSDFGDLTVARGYIAALSDSHGGLG
jgi:hypothetical protein